MQVFFRKSLTGVVRDRRHILLLKLSEFKGIDWLTFPKNHQQNIGFLMISGGQKLISSLKFANVRGDIWRRSLTYKYGISCGLYISVSRCIQFFTKIVNGWNSLNIFPKNSVLYVWRSPEYTFVVYCITCKISATWFTRKLYIYISDILNYCTANIGCSCRFN